MILFLYSSLLIYVLLIYPKIERVWAPNFFNANTKKAIIIYVAVGLIISVFIPYWLNRDGILKGLTFQALRNYSCATLAVFIVPYLSHKIKINTLRERYYLYIIYSIFFILVIIRCFSTGIGLNINSFIQWHHYSAYIGQAELLLSGVLPLNDIPLQYGLGPILITAAGCKINCWSYLYMIAGFMSALESFALAYIILKVIPSRNPLYVIFILLIIFITSLFYPSYQEFLFPITTYPSVSGLRFLPSILMLSLLIKHASLNLNSKKIASLRLLPIYLFWIFCIFWSPEAAVQSGILFFSYLFVTIKKPNGVFATIKLVFIYTFIVILMAGVAVSLLSLIFIYITGEWPKLDQYFIYFLYPPVSISHINSRGPIWLILSILTIWFISSRSTPFIKNKSNIFIWLILIMCMANFSYYLGHHDDYVLYALIPYFSLLLLIIHYFTIQKSIRVISLLILSSLLGWSVTFAGWSEFATSVRFGDHLFFNRQAKSSIDFSNLFNRSNTSPYNIQIEPHIYKNFLDIKNVLDYLHANFNDPIEIYDLPSLLDSGEAYPPWNALHGPVNFWTVPSYYRRIYLRNVAKRLNKSGWVIYSIDIDMDSILLDYNEVYKEDERILFGKYIALHFRPK